MNEDGTVKVRSPLAPEEREAVIAAMSVRAGHPDDAEVRRQIRLVLRELRCRQNLTQKDVGALVGVSGGLVSHMELGRRSLDLEMVQGLFRAFGKRLKVVIEDADDPSA